MDNDHASSLPNGIKPTENLQELQKQIDTLKKVIHDKNIQLNMVIKTAEEKYHDIHQNYRDMANELHNCWNNKFEKLEQENEKLLSTLTFLRKQNKLKNEPNSPISNIPITTIAESLDLSDIQLNQLTGGNINGMPSPIINDTINNIDFVDIEEKQNQLANGNTNNTKISKP
eukprot:791104_1